MPEAIVIDDDPFVCEAWAKTLGVADVETFERVADFFRYIHNHHDWATRLKIIILDLYLDDGVTGLELAPQIRTALKGGPPRLSGPIPIVMCTDSFDLVRAVPAIDLVIPKDPVGFDQLIRQIKKVG